VRSRGLISAEVRSREADFRIRAAAMAAAGASTANWR